MNATFENGKVTFVTNHFSTYAVMFENAPANGLSAFAIIMIVLASLVALGSAGFCVYYFVIRKKTI